MPTARREATRFVILDAAAEEFSTHGYRRSSVDGVSRRAGISRATLYQHWGGKEELFRALVEHLHDGHLAAMQAVVDDPPADLEGELAAVLEARFARFVELTSTSRNADDLYDVHDRICGDIARAAEERGEELIVQVLRRAQSDGRLDLTASGFGAEETAALLLLCAHAAKGPVPSSAAPALFRERLRSLMHLVMHGLNREAGSERGGE